MVSRNLFIFPVLLGLGAEVEGDDGREDRQKLRPADAAAQGKHRENRREHDGHDALDREQIGNSILHFLPPLQKPHGIELPRLCVDSVTRAVDGGDVPAV